MVAEKKDDYCYECGSDGSPFLFLLLIFTVRESQIMLKALMMGTNWTLLNVSVVYDESDF